MNPISVTDAIDHYHELLEGRHLASTMEALARATERQRLAFGSRPVCSVLRPYFIDEGRYESVQHASTLVMRAVAKVSRRLVVDGELRREFDLTPEEEAVSEIVSPYGLPDVSGRLDGFLSEEGDFHFVEYNAESPGGLAYGDALVNAFGQMPVMQEFGGRYGFRSLPVRTLVFDALLGAYHRSGGKGLPNIAIVDWRGVSTYTEFLLMQEEFESHGCSVRISDPDELEYRGGRLVIEDFPVDLVYKRVVIQEFLAKYGLKHPLIEAVRAGAVCLANGFGVHMLNKKSLFAILSDPAYAYLFEPEILQVIGRHIPWTRKVRECKTAYRDMPIDLIPFIAENREKFVLKPNGEYGGKGVALGWETEESAWRVALEGALGTSYLVQERVPLGREIYPSFIDGRLRFDERYYDLDPYVWNGEQVEGCGVRLSSLALLNVSAGGGSATPMFIIREG